DKKTLVDIKAWVDMQLSLRMRMRLGLLQLHMRRMLELGLRVDMWMQLGLLLQWVLETWLEIAASGNVAMHVTVDELGDVAEDVD
ncbi:hypothetical protein PJI17_32315, partial [Mycobacterium kansasii]